MGIINISSIRIKILEVINICIVLNAVGVLYSMAVIIALNEPQAYIAVIILALVLVGSILTKKKFIYF